MFPKKRDYENLHLFKLVELSNEAYYQKLATYYEEKITLFKISILIDFPIVFVLSLYGTIHFNYPWWSFFIFFLLISCLSYFIVIIPIFHSLTKEIFEKEQTLFKKADEELSELAKKNYFSNDSKAKRLLNQEFELVKLQAVSSKHINLILKNQSLATQKIEFYRKEAGVAQMSKHLFYEKRPLKPIALATINFIGDDKAFSIQAKIPIEYELVHGLVSEQIIYFEKDNYLVNPSIYIDQNHFNELYQFD